MGIVFIVGVLFVVAVGGEDVNSTSSVPSVVETQLNNDLSNTELLQAFTIFRHGDRTPDLEELILYPAEEKLDDKIFFPYGMKALTNKGKQRGFAVGKYLRKRYDGLISKLYLPDEVNVRSTSYARTKMTVLTALAALYPPAPSQRWNPALNWQPVPYDTPEYDYDPLMYWYNCPRYIKLRNKVYQEPEIVEWLKPYQDLISYLHEKTGRNITTAEDVFFFDNVLQTLSNVGVKPPQWVQDVWPQIKEVTKIEFATEYYTPEMKRLASGVLLHDILNYTSSYIAGDTEQPKLRLYSAHENNVAALLAAALVFEPHQPSYGSTFSLELRKGSDGQYYIAAVYAKDAGGPARVLPVAGCGGGLLCEYDKFVSLVKDFAWTKEEFYESCGIVPSR